MRLVQEDGLDTPVRAYRIGPNGKPRHGASRPPDAQLTMAEMAFSDEEVTFYSKVS
jgi:hypothetical protein